MPVTRELAVRDGQVLLMVGTGKGAFFFTSNAARSRWASGGPHFAGHAVYSLAYDDRGGRRILAGTQSEHWGPSLRWSDDFGKTWSDPATSTLKFPEDADKSVKRIWQIEPGRDGEPGVLWAGVEPAALFESRDRGESWSLVRGLHDHPHRPRWEPGGGGLCLHTIIPDPERPGRLTIAISTGGVYRTEDGGRTWTPRNVGIRAEFLPEKYPEFGQCVHKIVRHPSRPETLFLQNHWGLYRSDDAGDSWQDVARDVPSDFGFAMAMHPHDPDVVYVLPLESDMFRCTPEGRLRVYRTRDGGGSWEPMTRGLPQAGAWETVLRDSMNADDLNPAGLYFGTRSGKVYGSSNGGTSWTLVADGLPPILCVRATGIGDVARSRAGSRQATARPKRAAAARLPTTKKPASRTRAAAARRPKAKTSTSRGRAAAGPSVRKSTRKRKPAGSRARRK